MHPDNNTMFVFFIDIFVVMDAVNRNVTVNAPWQRRGPERANPFSRFFVISHIFLELKRRVTSRCCELILLLS